MQVGPYFRRWTYEKEGRVGLHYWCEGCRGIHGVTIQGPGAWGFNGDYERPTFTPSVLTTGVRYKIDPKTNARTGEAERDASGEPLKLVCHTFIRDGQVQFLGDCGHEFAGQTRPMPVLPAQCRDDAPD